MSKAPPEAPTRATLDRADAIARDNLVFSERRARDVENQAKTARLRAMRLAHEAAQGRFIYKCRFGGLKSL